jgi:hypothetical protein
VKAAEPAAAKKTVARKPKGPAIDVPSRRAPRKKLPVV